ncbi:SUR7/PalI family-domain-containing protein [Paraphoma chrysanthemicola]|uniref:SUR7/PalI family-domain-containing protein n=1 Tax=Paraphoma chrysanthemicola TaxID=798071 RepID=A0A8K0RAV0_9PLEO|nr:SUR7/PalI family-domain-containing protein [Paraphoma chrysanthemicola]
MGKAARAACIFTPWALTIASFACLVLITIPGWGFKGTLSDDLYFFKANFTELDVMATNLPSDDLTAALKYSAESNKLARVYEVHLYNFCERNHVERVVTYCSPKMGDYHFDPITIWNLAMPTNKGSGQQTTMTKEEETKLLGGEAQKALDAYRARALPMFIFYQISFWATLATIVSGMLAVCVRFGSLLTWFLSIISSVSTVGAVLISTITFSSFVGAMNKILNPYQVHLAVGKQALGLAWLAVLFGWASTLFWLFSACCCSGRNNPHHRSNKGGLWSSKPSDYVRGSRVHVEKTGGSYEGVSNPFLAEDKEPLVTEYQRPASGKYEPFRHRDGA